MCAILKCRMLAVMMCDSAWHATRTAGYVGVTGQHEPELLRLHVAAEAHPYGCYRVVQEPAKME